MHNGKVSKLRKMNTTSSSGMLKTIYNIGSYLLLFGKKKNTKLWNSIGIITLTLMLPCSKISAYLF